MAINIESCAIGSKKTGTFAARADPTALIVVFHTSEKGNA
jgi:hypothetical protein